MLPTWLRTPVSIESVADTRCSRGPTFARPPHATSASAADAQLGIHKRPGIQEWDLGTNQGCRIRG
jgi:hypothetical protein